MKRLITIASFVLITICASAQVHYGFIGGATFSSAKPKEWKITENTMYHAGASVQFCLPAGFSIQPSLLYQVKSSHIPSIENVPSVEGYEAWKAFDYSVGYLEVPVSIQWGPDLLIMRPYVELVPFVGYALNNKFDDGTEVSKNDWKSLKRWEYGVGLGAGLEVWRLQLSARYNWNFGSMFDTKTAMDAEDSYVNRMKQVYGNGRFGGVTLSLAFLF